MSDKNTETVRFYKDVTEMAAFLNLAILILHEGMWKAKLPERPVLVPLGTDPLHAVKALFRAGWETYRTWTDPMGDEVTFLFHFLPKKDETQEYKSDSPSSY